MGKDKKHHICIITTAHPADDVRVNHKVAQSFSKAGFQVTWVGPEFTFFDESEFNNFNANFIFYPRVKGKLGRLLSAKKLYEYARKVEHVDVYYSPEPDSAKVAIKLAKENQAKSLFDVHEVYHKSHLRFKVLRMKFLSKIIEVYVKRLVQNVINQSDLVVGVNHSVLEPYRVNPSNSMIVRSCAPAWFADGPPAQVCADDNKGITVMHGKSNLGRGTRFVLEALSIARSQVNNIHVIMFENFIPRVEGFSRTDFETLIKEWDIANNVDLRKCVPMQDVPKILKLCDVGLIAYGRELGTGSLPNRLFEYLAAGIPVIAPSYSQHIAEIIENENCGLLVDFENPQDISEAIVYLRNNPDICKEMGMRAREAFVKRHNWESEVKPLIEHVKGWFH